MALNHIKINEINNDHWNHIVPNTKKGFKKIKTRSFIKQFKLKK